MDLTTLPISEVQSLCITWGDEKCSDPASQRRVESGDRYQCSIDVLAVVGPDTSVSTVLQLAFLARQNDAHAALIEDVTPSTATVYLQETNADGIDTIYAQRVDEKWQVERLEQTDVLARREHRCRQSDIDAP